MKIHFISIGGAIMHQLAIALHNKGFRVTGSDDEIFDPSKSKLKKFGLLPTNFGWFESNITEDLDAIILGMHAKADNPELIKAKALGLNIYSFPEYIYEQSKNKKRVVIAGSHGKTTITSMVMHALQANNIDFDYLVGSSVNGFDYSVKLSDAPIIVIEGDEYLSSALQPIPKFHFYKPHIALISGVAWDHINVFPTLEIYHQAFKTFIEHIGEKNYLTYCDEDEALQKIASEKTEEIEAYQLPKYNIENHQVTINSNERQYPISVFGKHNLLNLEGAKNVCLRLGLTEHQFYTSIGSFTGAGKRLEKIKETEKTVLYRDFAHAPSKVSATVKAVRELYPNKKLICVLELHTYSSLNQQFIKQYQGSLNDADVCALFYDEHSFKIKRLPLLDKQEVFNDFAKEDLKVFTTKTELESFFKTATFNNSVVLIMSSGKLGGIQFNDIINFVF